MEILDTKMEILDTKMEILDIKMEILDTKMEMSQNTDKYFACANCEKIYKTSSGLWKHSKKCNFTDENADANACVCGKTYANKSGLWKHMKKCDYSEKCCKDENSQLNTDQTTIASVAAVASIMNMMKQNQEFQVQLLGIACGGGSSS